MTVAPDTITCRAAAKLVDRQQGAHLMGWHFPEPGFDMTDLKLLALDSEDLDVISATTQDAVARVVDMGFAAGDQRFALLMNRYAWEIDGPRTRGQRKRAALRFDRVARVSANGINLNAAEGVLELLDIRFTPTAEPAGSIELRFAGGGTIRLEVECIEARLEDLGAAWAAKGRPEHTV